MADSRELEDLIASAGEGDTEAFRVLFERTSGQVFRYVRARVSLREDALDALQEIYIDLWRALARFRYRSHESFYGFLFLVARRRLAKYYRAHAREKRLDDSVSVEESGEDSHLDLEFRIALRSLADVDRDLIELRYFGGLSFADIADALGISESAARVRHHRALARLRAFLGDI